MRVTCVGNTAEFLGPHRTGPWYGPDVVWDELKLGADYEVYGIYQLNDGLMLLVVDERNMPSWFPIGLFDLADPTLPSHWEIAFFASIRPPAGRRPRMQVVIGYHELTQREHILALEEREDEALAFFDYRAWARAKLRVVGAGRRRRASARGRDDLDGLWTAKLRRSRCELGPPANCGSPRSSGHTAMTQQANLHQKVVGSSLHQKVVGSSATAHTLDLASGLPQALSETTPSVATSPVTYRRLCSTPGPTYPSLPGDDP